MTDQERERFPLEESQDQLIAIVKQLYDATLAPRFQVLVTQGFVEVMVNAVIDAKCKNAKRITGNSRDFPYSIKLLLLNELGLLKDGTYRALQELKKHRNDAAHDPFFEMSPNVVKKGQPAGTLHEYCIEVILEFYRQHSAILAPIIAPESTAWGGGVIEFPTNYTVKKKTSDDQTVRSRDADMP